MPGDEIKKSLEQQQRLRYKVLTTVYEGAVAYEKSPQSVHFDPSSIAKFLKEDLEKVIAAFQYLEGEGLIKISVPRQGYGEDGYQLNHSGIKEIEQSLNNPEKGTDHFPSQIVQHFNAPVGAVQNAPHSTAHVSQNIGSDLGEVFGLIEELRQAAKNELTEDQQEEALDDLAVLEDELKAEDKDGKKPKRIKTILRALKSWGLGSLDIGTKLVVLAEKLQDLGIL